MKNLLVVMVLFPCLLLAVATCGGPGKAGKELCDKIDDCGFLDEGCFDKVGDCYDYVEKINDDAGDCKNRSDLSKAMDSVADCLLEMSCSELYEGPEYEGNCYFEQEHYEEEWEKCDPSSDRWEVDERFDECDYDDDVNDDDYYDDDYTNYEGVAGDACDFDTDCSEGLVCPDWRCVEEAAADDDAADDDVSY